MEGEGAVSTGKSLLIVEDEVDLRETLAEILRCHGFEPATAGSGAEALEVLRSGEAPRVILLDLMMPGMSGWEFRDVQLRDPALAAIPVVLVSGVSDLAEAAAATHAAAFLSKPLDIEVLVEVLTRYCG
jgi:CheY-like chemotaxis protein